VAPERFDADPGRLDVVVAARLGLPRAEVQRAIADGRVLVEGRPRPKSFRLAGGEAVEFEAAEASGLSAEPEPVRVLYQDQDLLVVSKPAGVVTHPAPGRRSGTLVNRLLGMGVPLSSGSDPDRPGIVHRLDAGTSGAIVVAKTDRAQEALSAMFRRHDVERRYLALVRGSLPHPEFLIEAPLERRGARIRVGAVTGRDASSEVRVREAFDRATLVEVRPRTGRTHQIRVHMSAIGHAILGDRTYGGGGDDARRLGLERPFLHSWRVAFDHPITGARVEVEDPLPEDLVRALARLGAP
jgi:23S rRNA pseudouridine1911/1915/1917 synthase